MSWQGISTDVLLDVRHYLIQHVDTTHLTNYSFSHEVCPGAEDRLSLVYLDRIVGQPALPPSSKQNLSRLFPSCLVDPKDLLVKHKSVRGGKCSL